MPRALRHGHRLIARIPLSQGPMLRKLRDELFSGKHSDCHLVRLYPHYYGLVRLPVCVDVKVMLFAFPKGPTFGS